MSANATGTPTTNFSIPKFNTASDAPNGKGVNEMMDALDTLLADPTKVASNKIAGLADHDVPVWNGTTFVRSGSRQINNGGQVLPVITSGAFASGPPGTPSDGDIWLATGVDANGTVWQFRYNAGSASSFKWEFVGGSDLQVAQTNLNVVVNTLTTTGGFFYSAGTMTYSAARPGDYQVSGVVAVFTNGDATGGDTLANAIGNGGLVTGLQIGVTREATTNLNSTIVQPFDWTVTGLTSLGVVGVSVDTPNNTVWKVGQVHLKIHPKRVS